MPTTDTNHVDLAEVRDRHRAYARAIANANLMRANEPQSTLTQAGRDELYATVLEAACESAKDVPGLADQVQQLRGEAKRLGDELLAIATYATAAADGEATVTENWALRSIANTARQATLVQSAKG
jgi:hypothetical protein